MGQKTSTKKVPREPVVKFWRNIPEDYNLVVNLRQKDPTGYFKLGDLVEVRVANSDNGRKQSFRKFVPATGLLTVQLYQNEDLPKKVSWWPGQQVRITVEKLSEDHKRRKLTRQQFMEKVEEEREKQFLKQLPDEQENDMKDPMEELQRVHNADFMAAWHHCAGELAAYQRALGRVQTRASQCFTNGKDEEARALGEVALEIKIWLRARELQIAEFVEEDKKPKDHLRVIPPLIENANVGY